MSVNLSPVAGAAAQFFDNSGNVLTGGKLFTYLAGTTTPAATYTSSVGITFHANPIILDAAGRVPNGGEIWLADNISYKFVLKDANDVLIASYDNLSGINSNFVNYTIQEEIQTATAGQTVFTLTTTTYAPGTNSLSVFVDGVNQYEGSIYSFIETNTTTVTFTAGLHGGALVKFTTATPATGTATNANVVTYDPPFVGSPVTTVAAELDKINTAGIFGNNFIAAGQPANLNGFGKGGFKVGGGTPESTNGMWLSLDGAANWMTAQVSKNENPTEFILYSTSAQGYATSVIGTNQITKVTGSDFLSRWVGNTIYYLRKKFKVVSVIDVNNLTVSELDGAPVIFSLAETEAFNYFYTSGSGLCNVVGSTVTFVSGDPFVPLFFTDFKFTLNGVIKTVSAFVSPEEYTLSAPPGNGSNVPFTWQGNINDQITTIRVQAIQGSEEENMNLMSIAGDNFLGRYYTINTGTAGAYGEYRPIFIGTGNYTDFSYQHQIGVYPRDYLGSGLQGYVSLGGVQGREGLRVYAPNAATPLANRISTQAAATGFAPAFRSEGTDTNIDFGIDTKGSGELTVSQSFTRTLFKVRGGGATVNWGVIDASNTNVPVQIGVDTNSGDANVSLQLGAKGNGDVILATSGTGKAAFGNVTLSADAPVAGYVVVKDYSGNLVKLAVIA